MKIFDELEYANRLLKHGFTKTISQWELIILAKYYRFLGKSDEEIEIELINFCNKHVLEFIYVLYANKIDLAIKKSNKYVLRTPVDVPITKNELKVIKNIKKYRYEKVLFTLLVLGKYFKLTNTSSKSSSKLYYISDYNSLIFRLAHTSDNKNERIMHYLYKNGYIDNNPRYNSYEIKFTTLDDNSEIAFYVTDINDIIKFYLPHCDICGKDIEKKGNRQSMCDDCWKHKEKENTKLRVKRYGTPKNNVTV